ncbi:MAG TPA: hypothetical protein VGP72_00745 [Planctomycetota bacterium]
MSKPVIAMIGQANCYEDPDQYPGGAETLWIIPRFVDEKTEMRTLYDDPSQIGDCIKVAGPLPFKEYEALRDRLKAVFEHLGAEVQWLGVADD